MAPTQPDLPAYPDRWFALLSEPVRQPLGLKADLQETIAHPPRTLPTPDLTVALAATETNSDVAQFDINVYDSSSAATPDPVARVSIVEEAPLGGDHVTIRES